MKRTPSMTWLARGPPSTRTEAHDPDIAEMTVPNAPPGTGTGTAAVVPLAHAHAVHPCGSLPGHLHWEAAQHGLAAAPASSSFGEDGEAVSPWAYGAEPGVDAWRPPPNCQTHDGSHPCSLSKCSFCQRTLGHGQLDIFMYRGDKAFCSLECRHHQILMDDRAACFKLAGKRFSMVPFLGPAQDRLSQPQHRMAQAPGGGVPCWRPQQGEGSASNVRTLG